MRIFYTISFLICVALSISTRKHEVAFLASKIGSIAGRQAFEQVKSLLSSSSRSVGIMIQNDTPFEMSNSRSYFESGSLKVIPPETIPQRSVGIFGVASRIFSGVNGVYVYEIEGQDFVVYFGNHIFAKNTYGAWLMPGVKSAQQRFKQVHKHGAQVGVSLKHHVGKYATACIGTSGSQVTERATIKYK